MAKSEKTVRVDMPAIMRTLSPAALAAIEQASFLIEEQRASGRLLPAPAAMTDAQVIEPDDGPRLTGIHN